MRTTDGDEVRAALETGSILPWYQPVVALGTGELVGHEALARWDRPDGVLRPDRFLATARESGLAGAVDLAVAGRAAADLARWQVTRPGLRVAVNLDGAHLDVPGWPQRLHHRVAEAGVAPADVDLELTETVRPRDLDRLRDELAGLRQLGYAVWLDDFGTGWAGLAHVLALPVDGLKIDRVVTSAVEGAGAGVVRAVTGLADDLGLATVAEGIESPAQADLVLALGCRLGQGTWYSPAVPVDEVDRLLLRR